MIKDLKPRGRKAPLDLIPARPLRAIAAAMEHGARKYAPWNWTERTPDWRETYGAALRRHVEAFTDPTEDDYDFDSGLHHVAHAGACVLILLWHLGLDYAGLNEEPATREDTAHNGDRDPVVVCIGGQRVRGFDHSKRIVFGVDPEYDPADDPWAGGD